MRIRLNFKNLKKGPGFEEFFNEKIEHIKHHLQDFQVESSHLHATLEKNPHKEEYFGTLSLYLPRLVLHCRAKAQDLFSAINNAIHKLTAQIEKRRSKFEDRRRR